MPRRPSRLARVRLGIAALTMQEAVQLSADSIESSVDGGEQIPFLRRVRRDHFTAGHLQVDGHAVVLAVAMPVLHLDCNAAADDAVRQCLQLVGLRADMVFRCPGLLDAMKRDLEW